MGPRWLEYKLDTQVLAEASVSEYRHKLDKDALRRLAQTSTIEDARPPAWDLLTTPGLRR